MDEEATAAAMKWIDETNASKKKQRAEATEATRPAAEAIEEKPSENSLWLPVLGGDVSRREQTRSEPTRG